MRGSRKFYVRGSPNLIFFADERRGLDWFSPFNSLSAYQDR